MAKNIDPEMITIATITGYYPNQSMEFLSYDGTIKNLSGEILDQRELPTGKLVEVHTELDENENVVNRIFVTY